MLKLAYKISMTNVERKKSWVKITNVFFSMFIKEPVTNYAKFY